MAALQVDDPMPGVRRITLNRPEAMNAFTFAMYPQFVQLLRETALDESIRVLILTGAGKAFCAGHDLKNAGEASWYSAGVGSMQATKYGLAMIGQIPVLLRGLPQPVICAVNGAAAGIGYTLALASDMTLAARSAKFVNSFHNAGTGHELGFSYLLPRAVGSQRAAEILYTGRPVLADEAERIGLVLRAVADDQLMAATLELAERVIANTPLGIWLTKQSFLLNQSGSSLEAAIELENRAIAISRATEDAAEKRRSFFEKRTPVFHQK